MTTAAVFIAGLAVVLVAVGWSFMGSVTSSNSVPVELKSTTQGLPTISAQDIGVLVHVVGGVNHPGIYQISPGSRVIDAVMAAGGIAPGASDCGINLARQVSDGEQIVISVDTACSAEKGQVHAGGALLSLNNATAEELDGLPGIGPTLAQRILEWREANGSFVDINQLNDVPGIGDKLFETLRELVSL
ncbi:ComEA family DNA-binding protein [Aurantimicrobium minutum]|uniref:ComEA family DNA-binding protein n=1 Tax=Aurantimicrobium minutum TaxID=708131 RepID=UPI00248DE4EA|nr:ComEA family DNA-binding protein [Aurantimicrobium minutum]